ncbi:MAG: [FeFe] hydrogenase H-cluster maturation GTPase HydF [Anaerovoracaceae bacterium]
MSLTNTPRGNRLHIGIFGKRNSGKSSLINALTGQDIALVSDYPGTTTDPVFKAMELHPIGPVVFIDTAGFDDEGELGKLRVEKTKDALAKTDVAIMIFGDEDFTQEKLWIEALKSANTPIIPVINKVDISRERFSGKVKDVFNLEPVLISTLNGTGLEDLKRAIQHSAQGIEEHSKILGGLAKTGDLVLLVMPQDIQAPKGRLILPQVQTIRELLDEKCITVCTVLDGLARTLDSLTRVPNLIITDSQCFKAVYEKKPEGSLLTSFSVLFAGHKGDIDAFVAGAQAVDRLNENSKVLIAEACTHVPLQEDIGREKIPMLLRKRFGQDITIDFVNGNDFPEKLSNYDLIIHCGGCMFNRKHILSRVDRATGQGIPITNYGVVLAKLTGILDKVALPAK